jgi:plastocyanin domain-containing protein
MGMAGIIITLVGFALIAWIIWYFWLWQGEAVAAQAVAGGGMEIAVTVKGGYQPATIVANAGQLLRLSFTRREATTCGEEVVLPEFGKRAHLPENQTVSVEIVPDKPGEYEFTCGMNMYRGKIIVK